MTCLIKPIYTHLFIILYLAVNSLAADDNTNLLSSLSESGVKNWKDINLLHYKIRRSVVDSDDYHVEMEWWLSSDCYRYSKKQICKKPSENKYYDEAWDGKLHMEEYHDTGILRTSKHNSDTHRGLWNEENILTPYRFLIPSDFNKEGVLQSIKLFQTDGSIQAGLSKFISITKGKLGGDDCIIIEFPGGKENYGYPYDYYYRAYFDLKEGGYPMKWEKLAKGTEYVFCDYQVTELGTVTLANSSFRYPKKAESKFYKIQPQDKEAPKISGLTFSYEISSVDINSVAQDQFMIDPSSFKYIVDEDTKKIIPIPK